MNLINADENYNYAAFITREEFCELVFSYINNFKFNYINNFSEYIFSAGLIKPPFADTNNKHIGVLNALDIINGKSETEFAPNDYLTREEAAVIINRLIKYMYPNSATTEMYFNFDDSEQISDWASSSIQAICNMGIMKGVGDNKFAPQDLYTTEQAITTLVRVYNNFANADNISNAKNLVNEKFMILSLPWGEKWENIKMQDIFSQANIVVNDGNRFAVELENVEFLGVTGKMLLVFSGSTASFLAVGFLEAHFNYDEKDEKEMLSQGNKLYGERKSYFLDKNGIENPLNPSAWYSDENMENSLSADERAYFEKLLKDKGVEESRADAIIRGPLVVISVHESDNVITINGNNAACIFNLRNDMP